MRDFVGRGSKALEEALKEGVPTANISTVRIQIDRFESGRWAVVSIYPEGRKTFDVPREALPEDASPGDVFDVEFERNEEETKKNAAENERLLNELLERDER